MKEVKIRDFSISFGTTEDDFSDKCKEQISKSDFQYNELDRSERDNLLLEILRRTEADKQVIGAKERKIVWEKGWKENLREFTENEFDLNKIVPKFLRPNQAIRFNQDFIKPNNPNFELDYLKVFRIWLYEKYFAGFDNIYEFGCGTGYNLTALADLFPNKQLFGLDFVDSSVALVNMIAEKYRLNLKGFKFDMLYPDKDFKLFSNSAVFTFGAIEQLAGKYESFLEYLLNNKPCLCVHIEPTIELYDEDNLIDYLAIKFHRKRGYTENFLPGLEMLEAKKKLKIVKVKRLFFGSLLMEGYSLVIWEPL